MNLFSADAGTTDGWTVNWLHTTSDDWTWVLGASYTRTIQDLHSHLEGPFTTYTPTPQLQGRRLADCLCRYIVTTYDATTSPPTGFESLDLGAGYRGDNVFADIGAELHSHPVRDFTGRLDPFVEVGIRDQGWSLYWRHTQGRGLEGWDQLVLSYRW